VTALGDREELDLLGHLRPDFPEVPHLAPSLELLAPECQRRASDEMVLVLLVLLVLRDVLPARSVVVEGAPELTRAVW